MKDTPLTSDTVHMATEATYIAAAQNGNRQQFDKLVMPYRAELQVYCYRMLGSLQDAGDIVQETLLQAWQQLRTFEEQATFRVWLYKIATHAGLDALKRRARRVLPPVTYPAANPHRPFSPPTPDLVWLEPFPDRLLNGVAATPKAHYGTHESIELAFLVALQLLPPRQRVVLILRDVLDWRAKEVAQLLGITVSTVNSTLHRARATLAKYYSPDKLGAVQPAAVDVDRQNLLEQYMRAWETANVGELIALLKQDAVFTMPPSLSWYRGRAAIDTFLRNAIFVSRASNIWRLRPTRANGQPAFGLYRLASGTDTYHPFAIQVLTFDSTCIIAQIAVFLHPVLFSQFGLPASLTS